MTDDDDDRVCFYCDDNLNDDQQYAHPECEEHAAAGDPRICPVCGDPLPYDIPDRGHHPECVSEAWAVGPDPFLLPARDEGP